MNARGFVPLSGPAVMQGHVAAVQTGGKNLAVQRRGFLHHTRAMRKGPGPGRNAWDASQFVNVQVPDEMVARMQSNLPAVVRRDPKERYRDMLTRISAEVLAMYKATGRITWPRSAWDELKVIAWKNGDPNLLTLGGEEGLRKQIEALTRHVIETGEMKQKRNDYKRAALDWHGH